MGYRFDPHRTLDRLLDLHKRVRESIEAHKSGRVGAAEEAAKRLFGEAGELFDKEKTLQNALRAVEQALTGEIGTDFFFVVEWGLDYLIYELETGQTFRREFKLSQTTEGFDVDLEKAIEVEQVWQKRHTQPKESAPPPVNGVTNGHSAVRLVEAAREAVDSALLTEAGAAQIKIIAPGQGSSGFYPSEVLKRDGPRIFKRGLHMFMDHPTESEEFDRPERSNNDLAGVLESDARWDENGPKGPGLYADASVFEKYKPHLAEIAPHTGVSIRAMGQIDGDGNITELTDALSVDFVTTPGAGGSIVRLMESAQKPTPEVKPVANEPEKQPVDEALRADNARLRESVDRLERIIIREAARNQARDILESVADMHPKAKAEVIRNVSQSPPVKDGALDHDRFAEAVDAETKRIAALFADIGGTKPVTGAGGEPQDSGSLDEAEAEYIAAFKESGMSDKTLEHLRRVN